MDQRLADILVLGNLHHACSSIEQFECRNSWACPTSHGVERGISCRPRFRDRCRNQGWRRVSNKSQGCSTYSCRRLGLSPYNLWDCERWSYRIEDTVNLCPQQRP